ncbi:MAG: SGNH/GDSL hydrolase family protein [Waterburya sp.]
MFIKKLLSINKQSTLRISIVGGSNSVMRRGYAKYLDTYISKTSFRSTSLKYYALGGVPNIYGAIQQDRHDIAANSDLIFFEYCVNDRLAVEEEKDFLELLGKSLEGFIRKVKNSNPSCLIVILIFGINLPSFYDNYCYLSELYESIGDQYKLPVINLTKILSEAHGLDYVKSLYHQKDHAHYTRPEGVQVIAKTIVNELDKLGIIKILKSRRKQYQSIDINPIYPDNFENLLFFDRFENGKFFSQFPKISIYQNTVFREKNFTIYQGNSLEFLLKGSLMAIFIKSDLNDGFINIEFNGQRIVTSSYSEWVNNIKPQNVINLITLPLRRFAASSDFAPVSISLCPEYPQDFELDFVKVVPTKSDPQKWKLSIIGIAYNGELKPLS